MSDNVQTPEAVEVVNNNTPAETPNDDKQPVDATLPNAEKKEVEVTETPKVEVPVGSLAAAGESTTANIDAPAGEEPKQPTAPTSDNANPDDRVLRKKKRNQLLVMM